MGNTPISSHPYPSDQGYVHQTAASIQALAESVEKQQLYASYSGGDGSRIEVEGGIGQTQTVTGAGATSPVTGNTPVYFVAPASGLVRIEANAYLKNSVAGQEAAMQLELRDGTVRVGAVVTVASNYNTEYVKTGGWCYAAGLTPGKQYNVRPLVRSSSTGTATLASPVVEVLPLARGLATTTSGLLPSIQ